MNRITYLAAAGALVASSSLGAWAANASTDASPAAHVRTTARHGADDTAGHHHHGADDTVRHHGHEAAGTARYERHAEPESGDDNGGAHETEPGDDHGGQSGSDDSGSDDSGSDDGGHHGGDGGSDG